MHMLGKAVVLGQLLASQSIAASSAAFKTMCSCCAFICLFLVQVVCKLLKRDTLLTFAIQKALRNLKRGEPTAVSHVTPDPAGQTSSLLGMRITPCLWKVSVRPGCCWDKLPCKRTFKSQVMVFLQASSQLVCDSVTGVTLCVCLRAYCACVHTGALVGV